MNQWDAADRVLREDFNRDNRKIDAAIAEAKDACPMVMLPLIASFTEVGVPVTTLAT